MNYKSIMKENDTMKCERCGRVLAMDELTFYKGLANINKDGEHSLLFEYNGFAGEELEKKYGEAFWEKTDNTEMSVALILGGECCEGDYVIVGSDFNELQVMLQAANVIIAEHHAENHLNLFNVLNEVERLMKKGKTKYRIVHWG